MSREFVDAHWHCWDTGSDAAGHDAELLGPPAAAFPVFLSQDHARATAVDGFKVTAAVHVEAIAKCGKSEAAWVQAHSDQTNLPLANVVFTDLSDPKVADNLAELAQHATIRGVRQILNWEPTWPKVKHGNLLTDPDFQAGYAMLAKYSWSFDLQINPHQMLAAAALATKFPEVPVVLNHLGCLKLGEDAAANVAATKVWREGMRALAAAGPHVFVKISMLNYTDPDWDRPGSPVPGLVQETLALFGAGRCMFATNFPVDNSFNWPIERLVAGFQGLVAALPEDEQQLLWAGTARKVYKF